MTLQKRPVAWRVGPFQGSWSVYQNEEDANRLANSYWDHAVSIQGLYVRDGTDNSCIDQAVAAERERCAQVADSMNSTQNIGNRIRIGHDL